MPHYITPHSVCQFGVARCDITPPVGIYHRMWGAAVHDRSEGVHRPLSAAAMIFAPIANVDAPHEDGHATEANGQRLVVVALDHCLFFPREMDQFTARVCDATGLAHGQLVVTFSHTHAAGLMDATRADLPGGELIGPYLEELAAKVAAAIQQAVQTLRSATITYATGRCSLAAHRDFWDAASGMFVCGFNPTASADDAVCVARVAAADDEAPLATIVNYACHPTTLAWDNRLISPDYVGALREVVERHAPAPCIFLQGASGDLGPREGFVGDVAVADRNGQQLAYGVLSALEGMPPARTRFEYAGPVVSGATIGVWRHVPLAKADLADGARWQVRRANVDLPYRADLATLADTQAELDCFAAREHAPRGADEDEPTYRERVRTARAMSERMARQRTRLAALPDGQNYPYAVALARMGPAVWLFVEGEPYNLLQRTLRERFPTTPIVVVTLANGWRPAYLPTSETYGHGIYQESVAVLAAGCLEHLIDAVSNIIADLFPARSIRERNRAQAMERRAVVLQRVGPKGTSRVRSALRNLSRKLPMSPTNRPRRFNNPGNRLAK